MSSEPVRTNRRSRPRLRHPAEVPLFIFMVVLNLIIVAAILEAAAVLPFPSASRTAAGRSPSAAP
jgi:hypothetical protein